MSSHYMLTVILIALYAFDCANAVYNTSNVTKVIESLLNNYDNKLRPNFGGGSVDVQVSMYIISCSEVSDANMDYSMNFYFRQYWNDPRLSFNVDEFESLNLPTEFASKIWVPDTFFVNEKQSTLHMTTTKNEFVRVGRNGTVTKSVRLSVRASCLMNLRSFPMDKQVCSLDIESYGYDLKDVKYSWKKSGNAVGVATDLATGSLFKFVSFAENSEYIQTGTGNYSRLRVDFEFTRTKVYYLIRIYIPCTMIVALAWISFWMNEKAYLCRLVCCSLALLLIFFQCHIFNNQNPRTSYITAMDVFVGTCMTIIFAAVVECAYVLNNYTKYGKDDADDGTSRINKYFLVGYPIVYFLFNIVYWAVYLSG